MLKKGFFLLEPFNPKPYWDNAIVNLTGNRSFIQDTVFIPGRYKVDIQAGSSSTNNSNLIVGAPAKIMQEIVVNEPFIVRAFSGSRGAPNVAGLNPYSGGFKANSVTSPNTEISAVTHIFGNAGSAAALNGSYSISPYQFSSGNCLGNGEATDIGGIGAGSCLHLMPLNGVFGTDYLFAFHCVAGTIKINNGTSAGVGSAYGGAGSGAAYIASSISARATTKNGGSTPYGTGGIGVDRISTLGVTIGNNGTGPGYGLGGGRGIDGGGAWFDGTSWHDSRTTGNVGSDGHIILTYLDSPRR